MDFNHVVGPNVDLYQGDCIRVLDHLIAEGVRVDALVTDPPYCSSGAVTNDNGSTSASKYCEEGGRTAMLPSFFDSLDMHSFYRWSTTWLSQCYEMMNDGGYAIVFVPYRQIPTMSDALQSAGFNWRGVVVWDKNTARPQKGQFMRQAEFIVWGSKGKCGSQDKFGKGVYRYKTVSGATRCHQTQKPITLMMDLQGILKDHSVVIDPFTGSGSTGVAALRVGHSFVGVEKTQHYFNVAKTRLIRSST